MGDEEKGRRQAASPKSAALLQIDWKRFGDDLRSERTRRGLTYRQFAAVTGVTFSTLARLESSFLPCNAETFVTLAVEMGRDPLSYTAKSMARSASQDG